MSQQMILFLPGYYYLNNTWQITDYIFAQGLNKAITGIVASENVPTMFSSSDATINLKSIALQCDASECYISMSGQHDLYCIDVDIYTGFIIQYTNANTGAIHMENSNIYGPINSITIQCASASIGNVSDIIIKDSQISASIFVESSSSNAYGAKFEINNSSVTSITHTSNTMSYSLTANNSQFDSITFTQSSACTSFNVDIENCNIVNLTLNTALISPHVRISNNKITQYLNISNSLAEAAADSLYMNNNIIGQDVSQTSFGTLQYSDIINNLFYGDVSFTGTNYGNVNFSNNVIRGNLASTNSNTPPSIPSGVLAPYNIADNIINYFVEPEIN